MVDTVNVPGTAVPGTSVAKFPRLTKDGAGDIYLSWIEDGKVPAVHVARYSLFTSKWTELPIAVQDSSLFVNWADFPQISINESGRVYIQYLKVQDPAQPYAYHLWQKAFSPQTKQWTAAIRLHQDSSATEHGFISSVAIGPEVHSIWLDGRKYGTSKSDEPHHEHGSGEMTLRYRSVNNNGKLSKPQELDGRTCDCCNTALALLPNNGLIAVYRDRSDDEIRDIYFSRKIDDEWETPKPIAVDNWQIHGCPVNGPAVATQGRNVAVGWYSGAKGGRVQLIISNDGGNSWGTVIPVDSLNPTGRVQVAWLPKLKNSVGLITWTDKEGKLLARSFSTDTLSDKIHTIAKGLSDRKAGFPQLLSVNDTTFWLAYTKPDSGLGIKKLLINSGE